MRIDDIDPDELDDRPRRRGRVVAAIALVVVLAGAGVGVFLWQRDDDAAEVATTEPVAPPPDTDVVDVPPGGGGVVNPVIGFPDWGSDYVGPKLETLYERTTDAGIGVRVQDTGDWGRMFVDDGEIFVPDAVPGVIGQGFGGSGEVVVTVVAGDATAAPLPAPPTQPGWVPPGWCNPNGGIRVSMTYKTAVGTSQGQRYAEPRDGISPTLYSSGQAEGTPFRVLVLQLAEDITSVTVTFSDGATDTATPVAGWAAVATPGDPNGKFTLEIHSLTGERTIDWSALPQQGDVGWQQGCNPPPPMLPEPGVQPADPGAAEEEIRTTFDLVWDRSIPRDEKPKGLLDDDTGIEQATAQLDAGGLAETAKSAVHTITGIVFTSPTEAWFQYDIDTISADFTGRFGVATLIEGRWRIARAVVCQDLMLAGVQCNPPVTELIPPGSTGARPPDIAVPMPRPIPMD